MTYPEMNGTLVGENIAYLLVYANEVTHYLFGLIILISFFSVVLIGSIFAQLRFSTRVKSETSILASLFATLGFAVILEMYSGILSPVYFFVLVGLLVLAFIWNALSPD